MPNPLTQEELRICELTGVNPHGYIEGRERDLAECRNRESPSMEETQRDVARLMGISDGEIEKLKKQTEEKDKATAPLTEEELKVCHMLNVEPLEYYAQKQKELQTNQ